MQVSDQSIILQPSAESICDTSARLMCHHSLMKDREIINYDIRGGGVKIFSIQGACSIIVNSYKLREVRGKDPKNRKDGRTDKDALESICFQIILQFSRLYLKIT